MKETGTSTPVLFFSIFLVGVGFSIIMPVLPYYAEHMGASAFVLGLLLTVYALCQFLFSPLWGRCSDRIGRKPVLLLGTFGFAMTFIFFALSTELWMLFAARIAGGILSCATMPTAMAYIADTTSLDKRAGRMGMVGASMGVGMVFGPVLGGFASQYGAAVPFFTAGFLALLNTLSVFFFLKESLPLEKRSNRLSPADKPAFQFHIVQALNSTLAVLFLSILLGSTAEAINNGTFALFAEHEFGLSVADLGWAFMVAGISAIIVQGGMVGKLSRHFGEEKVAMLGVATMVISYILFLNSGYAGLCIDSLLMAPSPVRLHSVYVIIFSINMGIFGAGVSFMRPAITAAVSKRADIAQGSAMGSLNSFDSLGRVIGPSLGGFLLDWNHSYAYLCGIAIAMAAIFCLYAAYSRHKRACAA